MLDDKNPSMGSYFTNLLTRYNHNEAEPQEIERALSILTELEQIWTSEPDLNSVIPASSALQTIHRIRGVFAEIRQANLEAQQYDYLMDRAHNLGKETYLADRKLSNHDTEMTR